MLSFSKSMLYTQFFELFAWIIIISTIVLIVIPWRWHNRLGKSVIPLTIKNLKFYAISASIFGVFILYCVIRPMLEWIWHWFKTWRGILEEVQLVDVKQMSKRKEAVGDHWRKSRRTEKQRISPDTYSISIWHYRWISLVEKVFHLGKGIINNVEAILMIRFVTMTFNKKIRKAK